MATLGVPHLQTVTAPGISLVPAPRSERPADVLRAVDRYKPQYGNLAADDASRAVRLVREAIGELRPRLVVNRLASEAIHLLSGGGRFRTAFDYPAESRYTRDYMERRGPVEQKLDIHGEGKLAGKTVYASVQFEDTLPDAAGNERLNTGLAGHFGSAALIIKPHVASRATFSAEDSFFAGADALGGVEQLPHIVLDSLGKLTLRKSLGLPDEQFRTAIKDHLRSLTFGGGYIEAQIRGASADDLQGIRLESSEDLLRSDEGPTIAQSAKSLARLASRANVPLDVQP